MANQIYPTFHIGTIAQVLVHLSKMRLLNGDNSLNELFKEQPHHALSFLSTNASQSFFSGLELIPHRLVDIYPTDDNHKYTLYKFMDQNSKEFPFGKESLDDKIIFDQTDLSEKIYLSHDKKRFVRISLDHDIQNPYSSIESTGYVYNNSISSKSINEIKFEYIGIPSGIKILGENEFAYIGKKGHQDYVVNFNNIQEIGPFISISKIYHTSSHFKFAFDAKNENGEGVICYFDGKKIETYATSKSHYRSGFKEALTGVLKKILNEEEFGIMQKYLEKIVPVVQNTPLISEVNSRTFAEIKRVEELKKLYEGGK
jgi:hypothetical protein